MSTCRRGVRNGVCKGWVCEPSPEIHAKLARVVGREDDGSRKRGWHRQGEGGTCDTQATRPQPPVLDYHL